MNSNQSTSQQPPFPTFREAFYFWLKLGFISFGGPAGQIGIMHEFLVDKKRWISESRFMHALNYCMILPGPEAQQLATYIGWLLHGITGALTAGLLFILPGLGILLALSIAYVSYGELPAVAAIFVGLKPAVVAIVLSALLRIGSKSLRNALHIMVAILSFILIYFFQVAFPLIVVGAIVLGVVIQNFCPHLLTLKGATNQNFLEEGFVINAHSPACNKSNGFSTLAIQTGIAVFLWILPLLLMALVAGDKQFWVSLSLFFSKAALVTFGGAYAVLPYVAQVSVEDFGWLSRLQMIDGLALGETTPGPLIIILVFVGFMAGYNHYGYSIGGGVAGLFCTAYYTFLPSFLFIIAGAPWVERTKDNTNLKQLLSIVTAAVVGVIFNLTIYFGKSVFMGPRVSLNIFSVAWATISLIALYRFKANMILWIFISGLAGLAMTFIPLPG